MPYSPAQNKLFRTAEHNPAIAKDAGIPQSTAKKLAHEGVKSDPKRLASTLQKMTKG